MLNIDEHISIWVELVANKEYKAADTVRDLLDNHHVFCFTTPTGYEVYHRSRGTRKDMINEIKSNIRAEKQFKAWLFMIKNTNAYKRLC